MQQSISLSRLLALSLPLLGMLLLSAAQAQDQQQDKDVESGNNSIVFTDCISAPAGHHAHRRGQVWQPAGGRKSGPIAG